MLQSPVWSFALREQNLDTELTVVIWAVHLLCVLGTAAAVARSDVVGQHREVIHDDQIVPLSFQAPFDMALRWVPRQCLSPSASRNFTRVRAVKRRLRVSLFASRAHELASTAAQFDFANTLKVRHFLKPSRFP